VTVTHRHQRGVEDASREEGRSGGIMPLPVAAPLPGPEGAASCADVDLEGLLEPMLAALMQLAGANAAALHVSRPDGSSEPVVAIGVAAAARDAGTTPFESWCATCEEARHDDSPCVASHLCRREQVIPAEVLGPVCKHVVAVPLRHAGRRVGGVRLMFGRECDLPPAMLPLLRATGDLLGLALDNARLARESLRSSLMSERQLMANEVHDSLAQGLTYMRMRMSLLRDAMRQHDEPRALRYWDDVDEALDGSHQRLRELITCFRSRMDPRGLVHALREVLDAFHDRTGVAIRFDNHAPELCLAAAREVEVFHIVQEALANVARHAQARNVRLALECDGDDFVALVDDDGIGVPRRRDGERDERGHYGIAIMRERARNAGGTLTIAPRVPSGTRVRLAIPTMAPTDATHR
jgi:two-component system nitrate/nitrite sensor histidine kinase NarX